jgi:hypothetical protein
VQKYNLAMVQQDCWPEAREGHVMNHSEQWVGGTLVNKVNSILQQKENKLEKAKLLTYSYLGWPQYLPSPWTETSWSLR